MPKFIHYPGILHYYLLIPTFRHQLKRNQLASTTPDLSQWGASFLCQYIFLEICPYIFLKICKYILHLILQPNLQPILQPIVNQFCNQFSINCQLFSHKLQNQKLLAKISDFWDLVKIFFWQEVSPLEIIKEKLQMTKGSLH